MFIQIAIVALVTVLNLGLGFFVFLRNQKSRSNLVYLLLTVSIALWMISSFLTDNAWSDQAKLFFGKTAFIAALLITLPMVGLAKSFPTKKKYDMFDYLPLVLCLFVVAIGYTNLIVSDIKILKSGTTSIVPGELYALWLVAFLTGLVVSIRAFVSQYKEAQVVGRARLRLMIIGIGLGSIFGLATNLFIPLILPSSNSAKFGPLATVILITACAYAIVKHKMFDIRLVVARSIAYLFSMGVLLAGYLFIVFGLGQVLSIGPSLNTLQRLFYVAVALMFALTLPYLKKVFDKITNKLFYRDMYDTQRVLDAVSGTIAGNVDPHKIQKGALQALSDAMRPSFMTFLTTTPEGKIKKGDSSGDEWNPRVLNDLQSILKRTGRRITLFDELESEGSKLYTTLRKEDISLVAPLVTKDETIGYLVLGPKKSGNIYNSQDVGLLTIASNELAVALQNAQRFEEIQAFNETLQQKVADATKELKSTNKKLIALDDAKDEFISMASHQLRTPLTSVKGYLSMTLEGDLGKITPMQKKALQDAYGSSQRMVYLIADFLNVSRIKTGKFVIEPKEVDLPQVVDEEIAQLREMAAMKDLKLVYDKPEVFPTVMLDDNKIRQVMMNMVDNAIYYTPSGGKVTIQLYVTADELVFKVVDTGIGVPRREQHKLFTKFFRATNAKRARPDGTGLGLFMAQKIVVQQGGAIIFESTEGKGSTFGFRFPLGKIKK